MTRTRFGILSFAAIAWLAAPGPASAGFLGSTITSQYYAYGAKSGAATTFEADGQAHARFANYFEVIVTDSQVIYEYRSPVVWSASAVSLNRDGLYIESGNLLTFADAPSIIGVAINAATDVARFSASNVTFHDGALAVNWARLSFTSGSRLVLDLTAAPPVVAEPPALALMLGGVSCAAAAHQARRRRRGPGA